MSFAPGEAGEEEGVPLTAKQQTQPGTFSTIHCTTLLTDHEIFLLNFKSVDDWSPQEYFRTSKCFEVMLIKLMLIMLQLKRNCRKQSSSNLFFLKIIFIPLHLTFSSSLSPYLLSQSVT